MVALSSDGHLLCSYMGTDPSFFTTPKVDAREVDYEQMEAELKILQKFIREASRTQGRTLMTVAQIFLTCVNQIFTEVELGPCSSLMKELLTLHVLFEYYIVLAELKY